MKVLVIGAHGQTGRYVVQRLHDHDRHAPLAMIRDPEQRDTFDDMGVPTVLGDLEYPIDHAVRGCDAVIFAAGSGPKTGKDKTVLIDELGAIRAAVAAFNAEAKRFVMLSGLNVDPHATDDPIPHWRRAKGRADEFIMTMTTAMDGDGLDYTIVCPGGLTDDEGDDTVELLDDIQSEGKTPRPLLAATLVACLDHANTIGKRFGVVRGETALGDALKRM